MKNVILILAMFFIYNIANSQTVAIDENNAITKVSETEYQVALTVSPKKASTLLVENIKAKQDTFIEIGDFFNIKIEYADKLYTVTYKDTPKPEVFSKIRDVRVFCLQIIRGEMDIK